MIKYEYDYNRLKKVTYPNHPENDITYTYGGPNARENRVGRLALLEDGSGATEYSYGRMGEVTKQRRTLVIPNVAVATYTTEWNYDIGVSGVITSSLFYLHHGVELRQPQSSARDDLS